MTTEIMTWWLKDFDLRMKKENRNVLLFMDNCGSHPPLKLGNVRIIMLPPNSTSIFQPMDQGVIQSFKLAYKKTILNYVVSKSFKKVDLEKVDDAITVLDAIGWINISLNQLKKETIVK